MQIEQMLKKFTDAVEKHDGAALGRLFAEDGVYHDAFYGAFHGRTKVAELIDVWFYKTAKDFKWDMIEPVFDGRTLYVRYVFSYNSILPEAKGARVMFEGVSIMKLNQDGLIEEYREVADTAPALLGLNFPPERVAKIKLKHGAELRGRAEAKGHL
ncbi:MAG: nuclear transport factor 2 family protein [Alphaproteobacteria bacterium]|nr:nuclear transport factor 2 family protein [Alphaproteobacteria bacterium]